MPDFIKMALPTLEEVKKKILQIPPAVRDKYGMDALKAGAKPVQRVAKSLAPVGKAKYRKGVLIRKPGTMATAIKIRTSKDVKRAGDVGVFVNVKPAKGAKVGKYSPDDPFYWRWVHFGAKTVKKPVAFLTRSGDVLESEALGEIEKSLGANLQKLDNGGT